MAPRLCFHMWWYSYTKT